MNQWKLMLGAKFKVRIYKAKQNKAFVIKLSKFITYLNASLKQPYKQFVILKVQALKMLLLNTAQYVPLEL
jgi:hypothetical protein